jgi:hypothetical protein
MDRDEDICAICLETCKDTYETPCNHKFCSSCVHKVPRTRQEEEGVIEIGIDCPLCRRFVELPDSPTLEIEVPSGRYMTTTNRFFFYLGIAIMGGSGSAFFYSFLNSTDVFDTGENDPDLIPVVVLGALVCWMVSIVGVARSRYYDDVLPH